jgi:mannose-1-phosphate guanylyltransferase
MKAMILAAGKGTRVRPLTHEMPKPMIPILGKPVMEYLIELLARHNIRQIMVNTSHLPQKIEDYFGDGRRLGVEIGYSFEGYLENGEILPIALGSAGGMKKIQDFGGFFDTTTLVICGDALVDVDLGAALAEHRQKGAACSLIAKEVPLETVSSYGVVVADEDGRIRSFQEKPSIGEARSNLVNTGIYIFEPEVLDLIPSGRFFDIGSDLFPLLVERGLPFYAQRHDFHWIDIGKVSDYWSVSQRVMKREVARIHIPGTQVRRGIWVGLNTCIDWTGTRIEGPVHIGSGSRIDQGCEIVGPAWIGHGCHIEAGSRIVRSVIFEHTRISGRSFEEQIVCGRYCVDKNGIAVEKGGLSGWQWGDARHRSIRRAA